MLPYRDVEVQNFLAVAQFFVERNRGEIALVGLDKDHPGTQSLCDRFQELNEIGRDTLSSSVCRHGKVIDVDLSAFLLELAKSIRHKPTDNFVRLRCHKSDKAIVSKKISEIQRIRGGGGIGFRLIEYLGEQHVQLHEKCRLVSSQTVYLARAGF